MTKAQHDYGEDAGAGFPTPRPPSANDANELLKEARWLRDTEERLGKMLPGSERAALAAAYRDVERAFIQEMVARRGLIDGHTFDAGLRVRFLAKDPGKRNIVTNLTIVFSAA